MLICAGLPAFDELRPAVEGEELLKHTGPSKLAVIAVLLMTASASAQSFVLPPPGPLRLGAIISTDPDPPAGAEEPAAGFSPEAGESVDRWKIGIAPYAWLVGLSGDVTARDVRLDGDISFRDIVKDSDSLFALMGAVDVEHDRLVFQFNAAYADVKFDGSHAFLQDGTADADLKQTLAWYEAFGGYRLIDKPLGNDPASPRRLNMDAFIGGRITSVDVDATLHASQTVTLPHGDVLHAGESRTTSDSEDWIEPFIGAKIGIDLTERWSLILRGDVGGFGISGAQFAWQTAALAGYRWRMDGWDLRAFVGFRALGQDYSSGGFGWDVISYGPLLGVQFAFSF